MSLSRRPVGEIRCLNAGCSLYVEGSNGVYTAEPLCPHGRWPLDVFGVFFEKDGVPHVVCRVHWGVWNLATGEGWFPGGRPAPPMRIRRE
jgi:hypothetical protein